MVVSSRKLVFIAFFALILAASAARLLTFDRYLPYIDHNDEPNTYILARIWRGIETDQQMAELMDGYPPLYVEVNIAVQRLVEAVVKKPWIGPTDYFYALRLLSALVGILTTLVVISLGWQLAGPVAGWFAGLVWGLAPLVVENNNYAISDPFVYLGASTALAMAARALRKEDPRYVLLSIIAGLVAIFSKYTAIGALVPGGVVGLVLLRRQPRKVLPWVVASVALVSSAAFYLVSVYGALDLSINEADRFRTQGLEMALSPARNLNNLLVSLWPLGWPVFAITVVAGLVAYAWSRRRQLRGTALQTTLLVLIPYSVVTLIMSASATNAWLDKMRHVLPLTISLSALWGVMIAQIALSLADWGESHPAVKRWLRPAAATIVLIGIIAGLPMVIGMLQNYHQFSLPNTRTLIRSWAATNVPADGRILMHPTGDLERTWNRNWGGYDGKAFDWWFSEDPTTISPREWADDGITYFVVSDAELTKKYSQVDISRFLQQLTLLKTIPGAPESAGPTIYFYRMLPPQYAVSARFGSEIALVGYDVDGSTLKAGETIRFRPYWRILQRPLGNYSVFVHLTPMDSDRLITQADGDPTVPERPTLTWDDDGELFVGGEFALIVPGDTRPGQYVLKIGLYDYVTGQRLKLPDGTDSFQIPVDVAQ